MYPPEYMFQNPLTQMSVTAPPGRTHLYYTGTPEFAFGTGLSYSEWSLEVVHAHGQLETERGVANFAVRVTNMGPIAGQQRVMAFARPRVSPASRTAPRQRMWAYASADLGVGESTTLSFTLAASMLAHSNEVGERVVHPGDYEVAFSDGASETRTGLRLNGAASVVEASVFRKSTRATEVII